MKIVLTALLLIYSFCSYSQKVRSIETSEMTLIYDPSWRTRAACDIINNLLIL